MILSLPECGDLAVAAGRRGLDREVEWFETVESVERIPFAGPGILGFTSGILAEDEEGLLEFVKCCCGQRFSGLVILTGGKHLQSVPERVAAYADMQDFPILTADWERPVSGYARAIGGYLLGGREEKLTVHQFLEKVFRGEISVRGNAQAEAVFEKLGIRDGVKYLTGVYKLAWEEAPQDRQFRQQRQELMEKIRGILPPSSVILPMEYGAVSLMWERDSQPAAGENFLTELRRVTVELEESWPGLVVKAGLGSISTNPEELEECFQKACAVTKYVQPELQKERLIYQYSQMGLIRLILECSDKTFLEEFRKENFDALEMYDQLNNTDLCAFLETYYQCNCSVRKVSETAYLHKNTVLYKLKKIEGILHCDFDNTDDLLNIRTALLIRDVVGSRET